MYIVILGYLAGIFGVIPMLPQLIQTYKSRSSKDISLYFLLLNILSSILWIIYGYLRDDLPIMICSGLFGLLHILLLYMKISFETTVE